MDESCKQMVGEVHPPIPCAPGKPERIDDEYVRNGVAEIFMEVEPLTGKRHVEITERRTRKDWAIQIKQMLDERYPHATKVRLVMDNLNTHNSASFYDISDVQAADLIEDLSPEMAAAILEKLDSDHLVDVLGEIDGQRAEAILSEMYHEDVREARQFLEYSKDSAGGIMVSEFLAYAWDKRVSDILKDLQKNRETYAEYNVQYLYVIREGNRLAGVLRMHDILFSSRDSFLRDVMIKNPLKVKVDTPLEQLREFFEKHKLFGVPVVDAKEQMIGVVLPESVEEASNKHSVRQFLGVSGIIGGEEFRSMPLMIRSGRRLSWLSLNIVLNIMAASVIAMYQDTLSAFLYTRTILKNEHIRSPLAPCAC